MKSTLVLPIGYQLVLFFNFNHPTVLFWSTFKQDEQFKSSFYYNKLTFINKHGFYTFLNTTMSFENIQLFINV